MCPRTEIKGIREGLLVTVGDGEWPEAQESLMAHLDEQGEFLRGARLILDVGDHVLLAAEMAKLRDQITDFGVSLWAVLSTSPTTDLTTQTLGMATRIHQGHSDPTEEAAEANRDGGEATLVMRTLRSGFKLEHPGHVTVIGDVNPGAEIIAGGNVVVWGRLRGLVHAGAEGDEGAVVCALDLSPTQLRIAGQIAITPQGRDKPQPEIASLREGQVVAETWQE